MRSYVRRTKLGRTVSGDRFLPAMAKLACFIFGNRACATRASGCPDPSVAVGASFLDSTVWLGMGARDNELPLE
jgi:hypothetical protein